MLQNRTLRFFFALILFLFELTSCSNMGDFQASSAGYGEIVNRFTSVGAPFSIDTISSVAGEEFSGRIFFIDGNDLYSGKLQFTLKKNSSIDAYFSNFTITDWGKFDPILSSADTDFTKGNPTVLSGSPTYSATDNSVTILDTTTRTAKINLVTANALLTNKMDNLGVVFANDLTTFAGGNSNLAIIAQRGTSSITPTETHYISAWKTKALNITNGLPEFGQEIDLAIYSSPGSEGMAHTFTALAADGKKFSGEGGVMNTTVGVFTMAFSDTFDSTIQGMFLTSDDGKFIIGLDITHQKFDKLLIGNK